MKTYKSLAGYKYYEPGFVHDCEARTIGEYVVILGKMRHSQRMNNPLLKVWIICDKDGAINSAHCTCMAGNSEVCSHVAALLFDLEHSHRSASNLTCTDVKAKWLIPSISNVPIIRLGEMKLKKTTPGRISSINIIPAIEGEELLKYLDKIKGSDDDSAIMRVVEPYASDLSLNIQRSFLPSLYNTLYKKENEIQTYEHVCALALTIDQTLSVDQCKNILLATLKQNKSSEWFKQRAGRITASNFKRVCHTSILKPSLSLVKSLCYPLNLTFKSQATEWGLHNEHVALEEYTFDKLQKHTNFKLEKVGLCVDVNNSFLAASPDVMMSCDCCGSGCVEVKCPYLLKNLEMGEYLDLKNSCITSDGTNIYLKRNHMYCYQVQVQLKVTSSLYCDFIVWPPKGFFEERIFFDDDFLMVNFPKACNFHQRVILPELLGRYFTKGKHLAQRWCVCNKTDEQDMVKCENDTCEIQWFHLECVGLPQIPQDPWICQKCIRA